MGMIMWNEKWEREWEWEMRNENENENENEKWEMRIKLWIKKNISFLMTCQINI